MPSCNSGPLQVCNCWPLSAPTTSVTVSNCYDFEPSPLSGLNYKVIAQLYIYIYIHTKYK